MLTIAELSRRYDLPESTARFYCKRFLEFIPHTGAGKRRRYFPEAIPVFELILAEMKKSKNSGAVELVLASKFPRQQLEQSVAVVSPVPVPMSAPVSAPMAPVVSGIDGEKLMEIMTTQTEALTQVANTLARMVGQQHKADLLEQQMVNQDAQLKEMREEMREEIQAVRRFQDQAEKIHQNDFEQLRKWLGKLAQAKPGS